MIKQLFPQKQNNPIHPETLIGMILIAVLLLSTITLSYLYLKDRKAARPSLEAGSGNAEKAGSNSHVPDPGGSEKGLFRAGPGTKKREPTFCPPSRRPCQNRVIAQKQPPAPVPSATFRSRIQAACRLRRHAPALFLHPSCPAPAPVPAALGTAPVKSSPAPSPAGLTLAADESPYPFVLAEAGEYLLIC